MTSETTNGGNHRPRILFLDAFDSFSNNITSLLTTLLDVEVSVLPIDSPLLIPSPSSTNDDTVLQNFARLLSHYDALVCGPGPGSPTIPSDVGLMRLVWHLPEKDLLPVLGVCLGFQSFVHAFGGEVRRLRYGGLHGMIREVVHSKGDVFTGVGGFRATLYHSLCGDVGQDHEEEGDDWRWKPLKRCPELVPLAWADEKNDSGEERILMAVRHRKKPFWGVQYHPESVCTEKEGNKVIVNWFRRAMEWNRERGRVRVESEERLARAAKRPSLLSQLPTSVNGRRVNGLAQWWELVGIDPVLHTRTIPLPRGVQVTDIVEVVEPDALERIVLDSANASPTISRPDVRGRFSIIATCLGEAVRIEYHTGDDSAIVRTGALRGNTAGDRRERVPLAKFGGIWGFLAAFHEQRSIHGDEVAAEESTPFVGGFMGYITYEQGLADINVALDEFRKHHRPDVCLTWVTKSVVVDHTLGLIHIQHLQGRGDNDTDNWLDGTVEKLLSLENTRPRSSLKEGYQQKQRPQPWSTTIQTPRTKEYEEKVRICQEYIAAGESYELCLTDQTTITRPLSDRPLTVSTNPKTIPKQPYSSSSWILFKHLRARQPAPFASYLRLGAATLVSASPERFLTYSRSGLCSMRPMKGTVRKCPDTCATLADAERILHVPKEMAENLMIVDLVRHDLHGVCGAGRVSVPELMKVEEYQSVFQMITVVEGQLDVKRGGYTGLDVLAASLPPGSMTGAPKKRSCELLKQIEGHLERSLYSGVVGYMCATGRGDWSVTIRSLFRWEDENVVVKVGEEEVVHEVWRIGAGGAVTALSTPEGEREEMFTKLAGPLRVFGEAR